MCWGARFCDDYYDKSTVTLISYPIHIKKSGPLGVLINEEVLRGMNLEEPTIQIGTTGIFMNTTPISNFLRVPRSIPSTQHEILLT